MSAVELTSRRSHARIGGALTEDAFAAVDTSVLARLSGFIRPYRLQLAKAVAAVLAFVAIQISIPYVIRFAVDTVISHKAHSSLNEVMLLFAALIGANAVASYLNETSAANLAQWVIFDMRRAMFAHLQAVSLSFMDRTHVGRIMSRLQGDVNALQEFFETSVSALGDLVLILGITVVLFVMEWRLALATLAVLVVLAVIRAIWLPYARKTFTYARDTSSIVNGALAENIGGVRVVQGARRERVNLGDFTGKAQENFRAQIAASWSGQIMTPAVDVLTGLAMAAVVVAGGGMVARGRIEVGVMIAFIFYVQRFFDPIRTVSQQYTLMQRATAAARRIFEVLDVPVEVRDQPGAPDLAPAAPSIEFRDVTFAYRPGQPVLKHLSFRIEPQQVVAVVGPTGSGKTSVASLIRRFYDVTEGQVLVAGQDVRTVTQDSLGRAIAIVLQEPILFTGSVLENIRYATAGAALEDVVAAAKAVKAHDFIVRLPQGYDTLLDQRGQNLSIGQRQLISFARALVANPRILILDEATASIDSFVEQDIQAALRVLRAGRTTLIIAHRLATVRDADQVIVLRDGEILEQGSFDDLLTSGGLFAQLYRRNFSSFDDEAGG